MAERLHAYAAPRRAVRRRRGRTSTGPDAETRADSIGAPDGGSRLRAARSLQGQAGNAAVQRLVAEQQPAAAPAKHALVAGKLAGVRAALEAAGSTSASSHSAASPEASQGWLDDASDDAAAMAGEVQSTVQDVASSPAGQAVQTVIETAAQVGGGPVGTVTGVLGDAVQAATQAATDPQGLVASAEGTVGEATGFVKAVASGASDVATAVAGAASDFKDQNAGVISTIEDAVSDLGKPLELGEDQLDAAGKKLDAALGGIAASVSQAAAEDVVPLASPAAAGSTTFTVSNVDEKRDEATLNDVATVLSSRGEAGSTQPSFGTITTDLDGNSIVKSATLTVTETVTTPTWSKRDTQCDPIKTEWDRFHTALAAHEQKHVDIDRKWFSNIHTKLVGVKDSDVDAKVDAIKALATAENDKLDADTNHGIKEGTGIDAGVRCSSKVD